MDNSVVIKANNSGIIVILDNSLPFDELKKRIAKKFKDSSDFLGNAQIVMVIRGRKLSDEEQRQVLDIIAENCNLRIMCLMDEDKALEEAFEKKLNSCLEEMDSRTGMFYKGNIRSGQELEFDDSVVIMGDVNNGATIISRGNIVIIGALKGSAYAGVSQNTNAFVVALSMEPVQIRIGNLIARSPDSQGRKKDKKGKDEPKIAFAENGTIYIENVTRNIMNEIRLD